MHFPLDDWQFYVVTAVALLGLWPVLRMLRPARKTARRSARTSLTIHGRKQ